MFWFQVGLYVLAGLVALRLVALLIDDALSKWLQ